MLLGIISRENEFIDQPPRRIRPPLISLSYSRPIRAPSHPSPRHLNFSSSPNSFSYRPSTSNYTKTMADNKAPVEGGQTAPKPKKSLYQRFVDLKTGRNIQISDEDMVKYTGKTKAELQVWSKDRPGVAGNQPAGKLAIGPATGLSGYETSSGYGGWGPSAEGKLKFPPKSSENKKAKDLDEEDDD